MTQSIELHRTPQLEYVLRLGDTTLIQAQRLAEWCGHAPALEEDIALTNMALESGIQTMPPGAAIPALLPLCEALDRTLGEIVGALRDSRAATVDDTLEGAYDRLRQGAADSTDPAYRFVVHYAGGYVRSVKTLAELT